MSGEMNSPEGRAQGQGEGREPSVHSATPAAHRRAIAGRRAHPALPALPDALTAALRQRVAQRAARDHGAHPPLVGHICERCLDAPAVLVQPAPWGGEMGVCATCQQETPAGDAEPHVG
jgi:hypothetical protein